MARRPKAAIVYDVKARTDSKSSKVRHIVRWRVLGRPGDPPSRSFTELEDAEAFRDELVEAVDDRERFDMVSGLPTSMLEEDELTIAEGVKQWVDREMRAYVPMSRVGICDDMVPLIARSAPEKAPALSQKQGLEIAEWLAGRAELSDEVSRWLKRWSPRLRDLERADLVRILERAELRQDMKTPMAPSSRSNRRSHIRQVLNDAVTHGKIKPLDWPPVKKGAKKKSERVDHSTRPEATSPAELELVVQSALNRDARSKKYMVMNATSGWAGLRPSEVFALEKNDLWLPASGWGSIRVDEARVELSVRWAMDHDKAFDGPKSENSARVVPIPPQLVGILQEWLEGEQIEEGRLFAGGVGFSHWPDSLRLACEKARVRRLSPYDLRRAYASHLAANGVSLANIAQRMGNTVPILTKHYIKPVSGSDQAINASLDSYYAGDRRC